MAHPARHVMDELYVVRDSALSEGLYEDLMHIDVLIEAVNRASHHVYSREDVLTELKAAYHRDKLTTGVADLIETLFEKEK